MKWRALAPLTWAAFIFGTSCTFVEKTTWLDTVHAAAPNAASPAQIESFWDHYWWVFVKGYHALEYFLLFTLIWWAWRPPYRFQTLLSVWLLTVGYAATDEYHQTFVRWRGGRWTDVVIDALGATIAVAMMIAVRRMRRTALPAPAVTMAEN